MKEKRAGGSAPGIPVVSPWRSSGITPPKRVTNGDGQLFYDSWHAPNVTEPALGGGAFQICPSLRWENFALGLQDYELLQLATQAEDVQGSRSSESSGLNEHLNVSQLAELVSQGWAHVQPAYDQPFSVDCGLLEWVRAELAQIAMGQRL